MRTEEQREKDRDRSRRWYAANREMLLERQRLQRAADREKYREKTRRFFAANPDKKTLYRDRHLRQRYGISLAERERLFVEQGCRCACCGTDTTTKWCLDHNHETRRVRGVVCHNCNSMLGHAKDALSRLHAGIQYLWRTR